MNLRRFRSLAWPAAPLVALALSGCLATSAPRRAPVDRLPPDSLALLKQALTRVRPAYATQAEALRSGTYLTGTSAEPSTVLAGQGAEPSRGGVVVVQIMAHRDRAAAEQAARQAEARFPGRTARVEAAGELYRVSLGTWESEQAASAELARIRAVYPDAWLRRTAP